MRYYFLLSLLLIAGCKKSSTSQTPIKSGYSIEELNYFYEVALNSEVQAFKTHPVMKWDKDIYFYLLGDTLPSDKDHVLNAIDQLNALNLPVRLFLTEDRQLANVPVWFGTRKDLALNDHNWGRFDLTINNKGFITKGKIRIATPSAGESSTSKRRGSVILEEITQTLGVIGDSYAYPLSIFYENWSEQTKLTKIDKRIIQLLYEPSIPAGYTCEQFEEDFADVLLSVNDHKGLFQSKLYYQNSQREFLNYVQSQPVSLTTIKRILQQGLVKSQRDTVLRVVKYIKPVPVTLHGDTTAEQKAIVRKILSLFEKTAPFLHLYLSDRKPTDKVGIQIKFEKDPSASSAVTAQTYPWYTEDSLFSQRIGANVEVVYRDTTEALLKLPLALADILYYSVCVIRQDGKPSVYENGSLQLKPEYAELLHTYYAPELANNMTKEQLESVLAQMK